MKKLLLSIALLTASAAHAQLQYIDYFAERIGSQSGEKENLSQAPISQVKAALVQAAKQSTSLASVFELNRELSKEQLRGIQSLSSKSFDKKPEDFEDRVVAKEFTRRIREIVQGCKTIGKNIWSLSGCKNKLASELFHAGVFTISKVEDEDSYSFEFRGNPTQLVDAHVFLKKMQSLKNSSDLFSDVDTMGVSFPTSMGSRFDGYLPIGSSGGPTQFLHFIAINPHHLEIQFWKGFGSDCFMGCPKKHSWKVEANLDVPAESAGAVTVTESGDAL